MTTHIDNRSTDTPADRASFGQRLTAVALGIATVGVAAFAPWFVPDACRWVGWLVLVLFVPAGGMCAFYGVRGRAADFREFTLRRMGQDFVGELIGGAIAAVVLGLLAILW